MKVTRGAVDMGLSEKYRFSPTISNVITMSPTTTSIIVINITTTRKYKDNLLDRDRVIHKVTDLALMTSLTIRIGNRDPFLVVALVLLKILRSDRDFRVLINAERRNPHLVVVTAICRRSLCAHDTSQHGVMLLGLLHNRTSVVGHLLTADEHSLDRKRATMVVAVITAVDLGLKATHLKYMSVALRALPNHAGADSSASFKYLWRRADTRHHTSEP